MELKQNLIHRNYHKAEAKTQISIGDDYSVPEGKPDMAALLQKKGEVRIDEVHTEKGKIRIRGALTVQVLYITERSGDNISSLQVEVPFEEILYMEGAVSGDHLKLDWNIEELRVVIIHPGKLSVRALVMLQGMIMGTEENGITEKLEEQEGICQKMETFFRAEPVLEHQDSYRIQDEILLPVNKPNVQEVLWKDLQLRGLELRPQEGRLAVKGEVLIFVLYRGEEEPQNVHWLEQTVPFHGTMEVNGLTQEMFGVQEAEIAHEEIELKPDYDGEMRMFQFHLLLDIHLHFYEECQGILLEDAYSTDQQIVLNRQPVSYEKLKICTQTKCRVNGQEKLEEPSKILQILGHEAQIRKKSSRLTEQGILWESVLEVQVLYITDNDSQPFGSAFVSIPCSQIIEIPNIQKEDRWSVQEQLEQIMITMPEGNQIEVRGVIALNACVMEVCSLWNITEAEKEAYDPEELKNRPGMRIHFVQPGETLWSIAKENCTTVEEIRKVNELTADEAVQGQKLLLIKRTGETLSF